MRNERKGQPPPDDPEVIRTALAELTDKFGRLLPEDVVEAARSPKHPLHPYFEWDMKKAAYAHWIERARQLIYRVTVVVTDLGPAIPLYVRDPSRPADEAGYIRTTTIAKEGGDARAALNFAARTAAGHLARVQSLAVAFGLEDGIADVVERFTAFCRTINPDSGDSAAA